MDRDDIRDYVEIPPEEEFQYDKYHDPARERILEIIDEEDVVTERELKVRLERDEISEKRYDIRGFFPWVVGFGIRDLRRDGDIKPHGYVGRRRIGSPTASNYFALSKTKYRDIKEKISLKRELTGQLNTLLTAGGLAGTHAEELFSDAFESLGFHFEGRDVSEYKGIRIKPKKKPGPPRNLDFVYTKDEITYGIDIKNWLRYEENNIGMIQDKVSIAKQLKITPFIIARYVDDDTMYRKIITRNGLVYRYWNLLIPSRFEQLAKDVKNVLGFPILATDELSKEKIEAIKSLHNTLKNKKH